jgi:hypothetical protein
MRGGSQCRFGHCRASFLQEGKQLEGRDPCQNRSHPTHRRCCCCTCWRGRAHLNWLPSNSGRRAQRTAPTNALRRSTSARNGHIVGSDTAAALSQNEMVRMAYLGGG